MESSFLIDKYDDFKVYVINYKGVFNKKIESILNATVAYNSVDYIDFQKNHIIIGPKLNFKTPWCSNILEIFKKSNVHNVNRIEQFRFVKKDSSILR